MSTFIETTEEIYNKHQGHKSGCNSINIVQTVDGRYVTSANAQRDFPHIFGTENEELELTSDDFPQPAFNPMFPPETDEDKKARLAKEKVDLEQKKVEVVQELDAKIQEVTDKLATLEV